MRQLLRTPLLLAASLATLALAGPALGTAAAAQKAATTSLPDAPSATLVAAAPTELVADAALAPAVTPARFPVPDTSSSSVDGDLDIDMQNAAQQPSGSQQPSTSQTSATPQTDPKTGRKRSVLLGEAYDVNGNPIPLERQQPTRILGFMPNFRTVSAGAANHPLGWKYNFKIATKQAFDYSSFVFLGLTSISAEGLNEHPVLGKGVHGFYSYTWRGFLDKTDGTYIGAWFLPSLLHEDTRYYPLGSGHNVAIRALYVISRQGVARTYGGHQTPNIAGLGGKVLTQLVSRQYYPTGATSFGVLAEKFGYAAMRDVAFSSIREFYPDIAAYYIHKHDRKVAAQAARDASASGVHP